MTQFNIPIGIDPTGAAVGGRRVKNELTDLDATAKKLQSTMKRAFGLIGGAAFLGGGVRLIANFQQEMSTVLAVTGATEAQFKSLNAEAKRLGESTRFSASDAAGGLVSLGRAGFSAEQSLKTLEGTLKLAQAGGLGIGRAADIATNVLSGFRLEADQTARAVDVLAKTANSSNTDVNQLGDALSFVAPVAAGLGVSLEETSAAIALLSNNSLAGARSGTGLTNVLAGLESPTSTLLAIFDDLDVSADSVRVSQVGLIQALTVLKKAGIDTGQALEGFGKRGGPAFDILVNGIPKVVAFNEAMNNATGTVDKAAAIMDDNLNGALLSVKSAFEGLILNIGELDGDNKLTKFVRDVAGGFRFLSTNIETVGKALTFFAVITVGKVFTAAVTAAIKLTKLFSVALRANPVGILITALTLGIGYLYTFGQEMKIAGQASATFGDFVTLATSRVAEGFTTVKVFVQDVIDAVVLLYRLVSQVVVTSSAATVSGMQGIFSTFSNYLNTLYTEFKALANPIIGSFLLLKDVIFNIFSAVQIVFNNFLDQIKIIGTSIKQVFQGDLAGAAKTIDKRDFVGLLPTPEQIASQANDMKDSFERNFSTDFIGGLVGDAVGAVSDFVAPGIEAGSSFGQGFFDAFKGTIANIGKDLEDIAQKRIAGEKAAEAAGGEGGKGGKGGSNKPEDSGIEEQARKLSILADAQEVLNGLVKEHAVLSITDSQQRKIATELLSIEATLERELNTLEKQALTTQIQANNQAAVRAQLIDQTIGLEQELLVQRTALQQLAAEGLNVTRQQIDLEIQLAQARASQADTFGAGFAGEIQTQIAEARTGLIDLGTTIGEIFGPSGQLATGIADAIAQSIVFGDNFEDSLKNIGKQIAAQLISQLIQVGIQQAVLGTIGQTLIATQTATLAAAGVATAAAWAPAAAAVSLASFGANAAPAATGIASAFALSKALSLTGVTGFAAGGMVSGPGTGTSDSIRAMLSDGEFVVNARSTRDNLPALQAINNGGTYRGSNQGSLSISVPITVEKGSNVDETKVAEMVERKITAVLSEQGQFGGMFGKDE